MGKFVHRGFMHPGGVSPMKQEDMFYMDGDGTVMLQDPGQAGTSDVKTQVKKKTEEIKKEESMTLAEKEQRRKKQESNLPTHLVPRKESKFDQFLDKVDDAWVDARDAVVGGVTDYYKRKPEYMLAEQTIEASKSAVDAMGGSWDEMPTGDKVDIILSTAGLSPAVGAVADGINTIQNLGQAGFNLITGDFDEAKNDAINAGLSFMGMIPFLGQGTTIGKLTNKLSNLPSVKKINEGIEKTKNIVKKNNPNTKIDDLAIPAEYKINILEKPQWSKYPDGLPVNKSLGAEGITNQLNGMISQGKYLDEIGYDASKMLDGKNIVFHGDKFGSGRIVVEVALPNGQTQLFYKSSGLAGKKGAGAGGTTEGLWQPFMGYSDEVPTGWKKLDDGTYQAVGVTKADGWHIKSPGYEDFYGSEAYRDIAGNLDKIAAEQGWDMSGQLLKSEM